VHLFVGLFRCVFSVSPAAPWKIGALRFFPGLLGNDRFLFSWHFNSRRVCPPCTLPFFTPYRTRAAVCSEFPKVVLMSFMPAISPRLPSSSASPIKEARSIFFHPCTFFFSRFPGSNT